MSDVEKRRRLMESLRGPAADVIRILKTNHPAITTAECLKALEQVFGSVESSPDVQVRFLNSYQNPGEKLSAYVIRLEPLLQKVVEKGAIDKDNVNQARLEQVIAGASHSGSIRRQLEKVKGRPLTFSSCWCKYAKRKPKRRRRKLRPPSCS